MSQLSFTIEVLLGIVSGQSNVGWNGAQQLYNVCNMIWSGKGRQLRYVTPHNNTTGRLAGMLSEITLTHKRHKGRMISNG